MKFIIINGPNLNLLGKRQPEVYGDHSFEQFLETIQKSYAFIDFTYFQSNIEGEIVDQIQLAEKEGVEGLIINAGAYSHTSIAIADAIASVRMPAVGVHISNIYSREQERHKELLAQYLVGGIFGMGLQGYELAIQFLVKYIHDRNL